MPLQVAALDALTNCVGWLCEGSGQQLSLRCGPLFRVHLQLPDQDSSSLQGMVELDPTGTSLVMPSCALLSQSLVALVSAWNKK